MASVDKVKVDNTTYDVSPGATGTLNGYISNDSVTPPAWSEVSSISAGDSNSTIFGKLTTMVKNVRWLYNKLGTVDISGIGNGTVSGALNTVQSGLNGKADEGHSHGVSDLPVSSSQVDSASYIPNSAVVYSLKSTIDSMNTEVGEMLAQVDPPNGRYESRDLGTWSSVSDVDTFLSTYNHENNYSGLQLGNYVTIQDGTYNVQWEIAGFDMEHNQTAADSTTYDNGYGICLIPKECVDYNTWHHDGYNPMYYIGSTVHTTHLPNIVAALRNILDSHIVNRNALLSSATYNNSSSAYRWTTAEATLMSIGQMNGTFASYNNKYDDGEANYKLPVFDNEDFKNGCDFFSRALHGKGSKRYSVWGVQSSGLAVFSLNDTRGIRPLIYIR